MNLKTTTDSVLLERTESLVRQERELLTSVLQHLHEINRRRLFSSMGYKSLFDFAVRHLGYPEDQAYRRIAAMKLVQEIPEIETSINSGEISLSHIGLAQTLFRQEQKARNQFSRTQKLEVLEKIKSKPIREAQRLTLSFSSISEPIRPDRVIHISETSVEIKFAAPQELQIKVERLKGLLAHKHPNITLAELFDKLCDLGLTEWDPAKTATSRKRRVNGPVQETDLQSQIPKAEGRRQISNAEGDHQLYKAECHRQPSKAEVRRRIFQRAGCRCERCGSNFALEVDHIQPKALGGTSDEGNLRLLCRACNQRAAIKAFGALKMERFISRT